MPRPAASLSLRPKTAPRPAVSWEERVQGGRKLAELAGWPVHCPNAGCAPRPSLPFGHCAGRLRPVATGWPRTHASCLLICWRAYHDPSRLSLRDLLAFERFRFGPEAAGRAGPISTGAIGLAALADGWAPLEAELGWDENPVSEGLRTLDPDWSPDREGGSAG